MVGRITRVSGQGSTRNRLSTSGAGSSEVQGRCKAIAKARLVVISWCYLTDHTYSNVLDSVLKDRRLEDLVWVSRRSFAL